MMKQLVQGACGGLRWRETLDLAEHIAKRAAEEGFPSTKRQRRALGVRVAQKAQRKMHAVQVSSPLPASGDAVSLVKTSDAALALRPRQKRLVTYDVLDCTFGSGYHSGAVLENGKPYTRVVALDCDPEAVTSAEELVAEFGSSRFRFLLGRMSEAKALFGEQSFDAVMVDPGASLTQLENPERGFLLADDSEHSFDMRYGPQVGVSALEYINTVPQHVLASSLASYGVLTGEQSMKMARTIRQKRPFHGSRRLLEAVEEAGYDLPDEGWWSQDSRKNSSLSWKLLTSLRCVVNNERFELEEALRSAFFLLRKNGRLVVFSRLAWEEELVRTTIDSHPHGLLCYTEDITVDDVQQHGHTRHTKMWVATRINESAFVLKNTVGLTDEAVRESSIRWMSDLYSGQTHGFPAENTTFENPDARERRTMRRNAQPPDFDWDDDPRHQR